ncbi:MAG: three-Cys-motif partner protein TcmP, partial [Gammaproteobacteria bacterium]
EIHFIEGKRSHFESLKRLLEDHADRKVTMHLGDSNEIIPNICTSIRWRRSNGARAVAFVDPYGINANWETLGAMQRTRAIDVWYLFNTFGAYRQLPKHLDLLEPEKDRSLTRVFGSDAWKRAFFLSGEEAQADLFGGAEGGEKNATVADVAAFMRTRLAAVFPFVSKPLPLAANNQPQAFTLFLCVSNPSPKAWGLAAKVAKHILDKQGS